MTLRTWLYNRVREGSTLAGAAVIGLAELNIQTSNSSVNQAIQIFNAIAPVVGGILAGASTKHT